MGKGLDVLTWRLHAASVSVEALGEKPQMTEILRARCSRFLKRRVLRITQHTLGQDEADLIRRAVEGRVEEEEKRLGLPPLPTVETEAVLN